MDYTAVQNQKYRILDRNPSVAKKFDSPKTASTFLRKENLMSLNKTDQPYREETERGAERETE